MELTLFSSVHYTLLLSWELGTACKRMKHPKFQTKFNPNRMATNQSNAVDSSIKALLWLQSVSRHPVAWTLTVIAQSATVCGRMSTAEEKLVLDDGGARDGRDVVRVCPAIPLLSSQPPPSRISSTRVDMAHRLRLVWRTQPAILPKTPCDESN